MVDNERFYHSGTACIQSFCSVSTAMAYSGIYSTGGYGAQSSLPSKEENKKAIKKKIKAEAKACELMKELIGHEQGQIYAKTKRVITKPNNYFWIVGDIFNNRYSNDPFYGNPDVVRIDDENKLYYTKFCVVQLGSGQTPYTDKVISFSTNLHLDEKSFKKTVNRISEGRFNKIAECAIWKEGEK